MENNQTNSAYGNEQLRRRSLISEIRRRDSREAAKLLMGDAIMLCTFEEGSFRVFSGLRSPPDLERQSLHLGGLPANFAIVHGDPRNAQLPRLIGDLAGCMESGFVAGGLTSSRREFVQIADGVAKGGLSGVLFSDDVVVSTRLTQGCSPIGPRHTITGSQQNIIVSLDGRAALDVFEEDVGELAWKNFT